MKKSLPNKKGSLAAKESTELPKISALMESMEPSYQAIIDHMKRIWAQEIIQGEIILATCKKLGKCKPEDLVVVINNLPTRKKVDELEAKNNFLLVKANKLKNKLDEHKAKNQTAIDKLNASLFLNQKLEEFVSHLGDVLNKARLFDNNLATNHVLAAKVISILVEFAAKMEELLDDMRSLFNRLGPEPN